MKIEKCTIKKTVKPADLNSGDIFYLPEDESRKYILLKLPDEMQDEYLAVEVRQSSNYNAVHDNYYLPSNDDLVIEVEQKEQLLEMVAHQLFLVDDVVYMKLYYGRGAVRNMITGTHISVDDKEYVLCKIV